MSVTSSIFIAVICILFIVLVIVISILFKRRRGASQTAEYINEQIYVGNLPYRVTEDDLLDYFSRFGDIQSVRIIRNFKTGRSKGYAFVTYYTDQEARDALAAHGKEMDGRSMVIRIAKPRQGE
jgi:RNA recognition motif-containing protein